jgi:hypothetical protein
LPGFSGRKSDGFWAVAEYDKMKIIVMIASCFVIMLIFKTDFLDFLSG